MSLCVKGRENEIELCFEKDTELDEAMRMAEDYAKRESTFFSGAQIAVSYSGLSLTYNEELKFAKFIKGLFGEKASFVKKHRLSNEQIEYSLEKGERVCLVINKSLRSGEKVCARGDVLVYGDVNPGATVKASGNITIIGALRGEAHITGGGRVYAVQMQPSQIRIGKIISYNKKTENVGTAVALAQNGEIILQCL